MGITVLKNNVPWGPFTRAQIDEGLERGDFTLQSLAHAPGMTRWLPLEEVLHNLEPALPPVPATRDLPPVPNPVATTKPQPPALPVQPVAEVTMAEPELASGGFFSRAVAFMIDCLVLFGPILILVALSAFLIEIRGWWESLDAESMRQEWILWHRNFQQLLLTVAIGLGWIYAAGLESSPWQATVGKRWMGLKVTDARGERLGFLRATGRHLGKYLSALPCFLGFIIALFSSRGLTLHDRLAKTRVVQG